MPAETAIGVSAPAASLSRRERSRLAICEACLDLIQEGVFQPSAEQVADRAGLSRRSVFNHFTDLRELYDAVVEVGMERCAPLLEEIPSDGSLEDRARELVRVRSAFFEATAMFTRALTAQALVGSASDQALRVSRAGVQRQHDEIERVFAGELSGLGADARDELLEALGSALSALSWEGLRTNRRLAPEDARRVWVRTVRALLADAGSR